MCDYESYWINRFENKMKIGNVMIRFTIFSFVFKWTGISVGSKTKLLMILHLQFTMRLYLQFSSSFSINLNFRWSNNNKKKLMVWLNLRFSYNNYLNEPKFRSKRKIVDNYMIACIIFLKFLNEQQFRFFSKLNENCNYM